MSSSNKFFLVEDFVDSYLTSLHGVQALHDVQGNQLSLAVLDVAKSLVRLGMVATRHEIIDLAKPLLNVLDGRHDVLEAHQTEPLADEVRYAHGEHSALIMEVNGMIDVLTRSTACASTSASRSSSTSSNRSSRGLGSRRCCSSRGSTRRAAADGGAGEEARGALRGGEGRDGGDLDCISQTGLVLVCLDLMMYEDPRLRAGVQAPPGPLRAAPRSSRRRRRWC